MTELYIVQENSSMEVIGVYDSLEAAKVAGEIWTKQFIIICKTLNSPCDIDSSSYRRKSKVIYESGIYQ